MVFLLMIPTDLIICFQEDIEKIPHSELTDSTEIGQGGFGVAYRAKHRRLGTVVYKKLYKQKVDDKYATVALVLQHCIQYMHCISKQLDLVLQKMTLT